MKLETALWLVKDELIEAQKTHQEPFHSGHEGYAVIKEELDELWDEIKNKRQDGDKIRKEAVQVAAMAVRFLIDLYY